jgi:cytidylate kinase
VSPLRAAADAVLIDTSDLTAEAAVAYAIDEVTRRLAAETGR